MKNPARWSRVFWLSYYRKIWVLLWLKFLLIWGQHYYLNTCQRYVITSFFEQFML